MVQTIMNTIITVIVSAIFGYLIGIIKNYKKKLQDKHDESIVLKEALMTMLQSNLTNTFYVYDSKKKIPDYVYRNWVNSFNIYKKLNGNEYCDTLKAKMDTWTFVKTDILDK